jgi:iron uptake system component EfeO
MKMMTSKHNYSIRAIAAGSIVSLLILATGGCKSAPQAETSSPSASASSSTAESATATKAAVDPKQLDAAIAAYKTYVEQETTQLADQSKLFADAVLAGDLEKAQQLYAPTRMHYERSEPIAELFSDLDGSIDAREDDYAKKSDDPKFTGFHRLEKILFHDKTTEGAKPFAEKLKTDTVDLQKRIATLTIKPKDMVGGAAALIEEVSATKVTGEEDRYSKTDLWDFSANVEGAQKIVQLLHPILEKADPTLLGRVDNNFKIISDSLAKYKTTDGGFESYDKLTDQDRKTLKTVIAAQAENLSKLRGTLGVN